MHGIIDLLIILSDQNDLSLQLYPILDRRQLIRYHVRRNNEEGALHSGYVFHPQDGTVEGHQKGLVCVAAEGIGKLSARERDE